MHVVSQIAALAAAVPLAAAHPQQLERATSSWLRDAAREVECSEYAFSALAPERFTAPNRSQGLRARIDGSRVEVFSRATDVDDELAPWRLELRTVAFGTSAVEDPIVIARDNRVELHRAAFVEWFVNDERGLEQGWTIGAPPSDGDAPLWIELEATGLRARVAADARSASFVDASGELRLRYTDLRAWDADGRGFAARLRPSARGLAVEVDATGARYPLTVDPLLTGPAWTAEGNLASAEFGCCVASAGDVDGDGFDDVIVGACRFDNGQNEEGRAFVFRGSASGLSSTPAWTAEGNQNAAHFGASCSGAGDVDGDGYDDVIVGARHFDNGQQNEGRAFVYRGSATGLAATPAWTAESDQVNATFGASVARAGDVDGDGYDDVIVGAAELDNGQTDEGRAFVFLGSPSGLSSTPDWTAEADQASALFAFSVAAAGDVDGDGYDEVIVGAFDFDNGQTDEGRAFVYAGSASGLSASPTWTAESDQAMAFFGIDVAGAGDVNGDGFDDVIVGAHRFDSGESDEGRAFVFLGSASGLAPTPAWTAESNQASALFGYDVAPAGDVDGDGLEDVIVGAWKLDNGQTDEGRALVYLGSAAGPAATPAWTIESDQANAQLGVSVSGAGDVDGDGLDDVIVGANLYDNGQADEGRAWLYLGVAACGSPASYCTAGTTSNGCNAAMSRSGSPSVSATMGFTLLATGVEGQKLGLLFYGLSGPHNATWGGGSTSYLCVKSPTQRLPTQSSGGTAGACDGVLASDWLAYLAANPTALGAPFSAGTNVWAQAWFRDPASPKTTELSDGLTFTTCP